jgi:predicted dehydrogenase
VFVLQNSRFKPNVMAMLAHVQRYHPGALKQVDVHYQSPPVAMHSPAWRRDERGSQTLLLDYSLHYLDVAMMFTKKAWQLQDLRHELNFRQETALIEGRMRSEDYPVNFLLRQGFIPRRARIFFTFENYACSLGFFPDTFVAHMTGDGGALYKQEAKASNRATFRKILDKLTKQESDDSHALAMMAAMGDSRLGGSLALRNLEQVYRVLFAIGEKVYGPQD